MVVALIVANLCASGLSGQPREVLAWKQLPSIPDEVGVAGPYAGVHDGRLIVAGGANFPEAPPWEGGTKVWHDSIYALAEPVGEWIRAGTLPRPLGYGVSLSTSEGVLCIGGDNETAFFSDVFLLRWADGAVQTERMPDLPFPLAYASGALVGTQVFIAGGLHEPEGVARLASGRFLMLDLAAAAPEWTELETWPGPERFLAAGAVLDGAFYLAGGARLVPGPDGRQVREYLTDAYRYRPGRGWERVADMPRAAVAAPSPAPTAGRSHFFVVGGDDGSRVGFTPLSEHPGFPRTLLAYSVVTNTWAEHEGLPFAAPVTIPAVWWRNSWIFPSGEIRPGVRTSEVWAAQTVSRSGTFGWLNYTALATYLLALVVMGAYFSRRQKSTEEFFLASRGIPWWAAGISIFGTQLSAITFIALPALVFATDWSYFLGAVAIVLVAPIVVYCYLPFFRRLKIATAYEYLEQRFNLPVRLFGSSAFLLLQLGRMAIVVFIPAMVLSAVTGINLIGAIIAMGVLATFYTVLGGIRAVIWTDVLQVVVLVGGALVCFLLLIRGLPDGFATYLEVGRMDDKFRAFNWTWDATTTAVWVVLIGNLFGNLIPYSADQTVVQRYLTTASEKEAARSVWTNAILTLPASLLFYAIGTALYVYYKTRPELQAPGIASDAILPLFVAEALPAGVAGIVIAGIFAAAMSSLDSSINSMATTMVTDFRRLVPSFNERKSLSLARWLTLLLGAFGTATAILLATADVKFIWDVYLQVVGLFGGGLAGLFALGIFSRRAHGRGAFCGAVAAAFIVFAVTKFTDLHFFLYGGIGILSCMLIGYVMSWVLPRGPTGAADLSIWSILAGARGEADGTARSSSTKASI
jgi:solute:Na+ symporter, SSS family